MVRFLSLSVSLFCSRVMVGSGSDAVVGTCMLQPSLSRDVCGRLYTCTQRALGNGTVPSLEGD